jgi:hypothetical protein
MLQPVDYTPAGVQDLTVLTRTAMMALKGLVYRSTQYRNNAGYYGDIYIVIKAAAAAGVTALATPVDSRTDTQQDVVALAQTLAAIANKLASVPGIAVESEGSQERRAFFSSRVNWEELANDVLDALYLPIGSALSSSEAFLVVDRNPLMCWGQQTPDELFGAVAGRLRYAHILGRVGSNYE